MKDKDKKAIIIVLTTVVICLVFLLIMEKFQTERENQAKRVYQALAFQECNTINVLRDGFNYYAMQLNKSIIEEPPLNCSLIKNGN